MIIETTCENGLVRLPPGLKYRRDHFKVTVDIPDQELVLAAAPPQAQTPPPMSSSQTEIRGRIDAILGPFKHQLQDLPPLSTEDYKDLWHQHLAEKHHDRD